MSDEPNDLSVPPAPLAPALRARRGLGLLGVLTVAIVSAALSSTATVLVSRGRSAPPDADAKADPGASGYQCPMHPTIVQDHLGSCPICGMKLVKLEKAPSPVAKPAGAPRLLFYRSPMDPKQTSPTPRKDQMGMDYVPVYEDALGDAPSIAGLSTVQIDEARQQLIGLQSTEVTQGAVGGAWRTVGRVAIDETRVRHVNLKVPGFVERIFVDYVGKKVGKGDPLFTLYSPDLLSAQEEYLLAVRTQAEMSKLAGAAKDDGRFVAAARRKLELWDIPQAEIDKLASSGQPTKTLTFYSPISGVVIKKDVVEGMRLDAGAMPYEIVDLSSVWVLADVYESELRFVKEKMGANLTLAAFPNREFKGKVVFLDPILDPQTRTVKVRLTFPNPAGDLRPDMFGEVVLLGAPRDGLRIPPDAVIDSGFTKVVFVAMGDGKFQPRIVKLGDGDGTYVEVISGLTLGERVVVRANFLVDSESRLRASLADVPGAIKPNGPESARVLSPPEPSKDAGMDHTGHSP